MRTLKDLLFILGMMAGDVAVFLSCVALSYAGKVFFLGPLFGVPEPHPLLYFLGLWWMPTVLILVFFFEGLYTRRLPFWTETQKVVQSLFFTFLVLFSIISLDKLSADVSRVIIGGACLLSLFGIPLVRNFLKPWLHNQGLGTIEVLFVGEEKWVSLVASGLFRDHYLGIRPSGWVSLPKGMALRNDPFSGPGISGNGELLSGLGRVDLPQMGTFEEWVSKTIETTARGAIIAAPALYGREMSRLANTLHRRFLDVYIVPNVTQVNLMSSELLFLFYEEIFLLGVRNSLHSRWRRWLKLAMDYFIAVLIFLVVLLPGLVLALLIRLSSPGPAIYRQTRLGYKGNSFEILKFRTMYVDAEESLDKILEQNPDLKAEYEATHKLRKDPRVTPIGRWLRATSLDEFPQILNVLKGEMSLVGPRPEPLRVVRENPSLDSLDFEGSDLWRELSLVKPGVTGLWQVSGRSNRSFDVKVRLDLWYIRNWSVWLDIVILFRTIGVVFGKKGAY